MLFQPDGDIAALLEQELELELAGYGRYRVEDETEDAIVLEAIDGLRIDKRDPRLRATWVRYGGAVVRVASSRGDVSLVVAHGLLAPKLGMSWGETHRRRIGFRWVRSSALEPFPPLGWPADAPVLDDAFRHAMGRHASLRAVTGKLRIVGESADAFTLEGSVLVLKGDPAFTGDYIAIVRSGDQLVRVVRELPSHVLAVAHPSLGSELGFTPFADDVSGKWLALDELEATGWARPAIDRRGRVTFAGADVPDGFRVGDEQPDTIQLQYEERGERPDLVALGFTQKFVDWRAIQVYSQTLFKTDGRLGGFDGLVEYAGYRLRVLERDGDRAFVVASELRAHVLGLERDSETASGWVPDCGDAAPRPPIDEAVLAALPFHNHVRYEPLGRSLLVEGEAADTLTLSHSSSEGEDLELAAAGFTVGHIQTDERYDADESWEHVLAVPKHAATGPFDRWVRYRGHLVREIRRDGDHVLLVAHPELGQPLGFANVHPDGAIIDVSCRWVRADDCEAV